MVRCQELSDPVGSSLTKFVQYSCAAPFHAVAEETPIVSTDAIAFALSAAEHQVQLRRAVIASTIGTAIEWYDFFLYSTVTGCAIAALRSAISLCRSSPADRRRSSPLGCSAPITPRMRSPSI